MAMYRMSLKTTYLTLKKLITKECVVLQNQGQNSLVLGIKIYGLEKRENA